MTARVDPGRARSPLSDGTAAAFAAAVALSVAFVVVTRPFLDTLIYDFDEAWLILDARFILRGLRPYVDFAHHEMPLHLYLLALSGKVFGQTLAGYRMLSVSSLAASGFLLFCLARPAVGSLAALAAQEVFLFSPSQIRALDALPETSALAFTLLGAVCLFLGHGRPSAYASGVAFVLALFIKPTCLVMILAAALSLVYARAWRRAWDLAVSGLVTAGAGLAWTIFVSDGVVWELLRFQVNRIGTRKVGMWSIDSGFTDMRRLTGISTPWQLAVSSFKSFYGFPGTYLPASVFVASLLSIPIWIARCARSRPALLAFIVLWPASYLLLNFVALDFVTPRYFIPFLAFSAFLIGALVWLMAQYVPAPAVATLGIVACVALVMRLTSTLGDARDDWYYGRADWITHEYPSVVSFTPMLFAATGAEPGCGFANPALTYGGFGEAWLLTERTRKFRWSDERLLECLRANRQIPVVIDWAFYFFTRPGSAVREYLGGEGSEQRLFFSPPALEQWNRPLLSMSPFR
jgi:4-amino-4-deoxy-L-arabinose transferase-like glycosyltransferase